ncbi:MAG TPA: tetratricopeptide repeat protein, partial [Candidatus Solibacter sp.]|nr:tetratricopeptide repeat protein [Candidatus Solibacter sp.]
RLIEYALLMDQDRPFAGNVLDSGNLITEADNETPDGFAPDAMSGLQTIKKYAVKGVYLHNQDVDYILLNLKMLNRQPTPHVRTKIGREIVLHEYAHRLLESNFPVLPRWFEEGFAVYFSAIKIQKDQLVMGVSPQTISGLSSDRFVPVATLFSNYLASHSDHGDNEQSAFYAESRQVVDYLLTYHKMDQAQKYFQLTRRQAPVAEAIKQAFNMTPEELDSAIKKLPEGPKMVLSSAAPSGGVLAAAPKVEGPFTVSPVTDLAVETTLADVHLHEPGYHAKAVKEFEALLIKDPLSTGAHRGLGLDSLRHRNLDAAEANFRKAIEVDPKNWLGHYYLALVLQQRADPYKVKQLEQEARLATELNSEFADAFAILASTLTIQQRPAEAATAYENALRLNPSNEAYAGSLAIIYMSQSRFDDAKTIFVSLENSRDRKISSLAKTYLQALAVREKRTTNN